MPLPWSPVALLSPSGRSARLSTFIFHRVLERPDPLQPHEPDRERFDQIVAFLARHFHVLRAGDALKALQEDRLPRAAACITFDDGYADNATVAAPVLARHGVQATFFVSTGYIDGGRMWNDTIIESVRLLPAGQLDWADLGLGQHELGDAGSRVAAYSAMLSLLKHRDPAERLATSQEVGRRAGLPERSELMMSRAQVRGLQEAGHEVGGHTATHPILATLSESAALAEIGGGREELAAWLGRAPEVFAYPNGVPGHDFGSRDVELVRRAGFRGAFTTQRGTADRATDLFRVPRFTPWDRSMARFHARVALQLASDRLRRPPAHPAAQR